MANFNIEFKAAQATHIKNNLMLFFTKDQSRAEGYRKAGILTVWKWCVKNRDKLNSGYAQKYSFTEAELAAMAALLTEINLHDDAIYLEFERRKETLKKPQKAANMHRLNTFYQ